jgi:hypothetical protein
MSELPPDLKARLLGAVQASEKAPVRAEFSSRNRMALILGVLVSLSIWIKIGGFVAGDRGMAYLATVYVPLTLALVAALGLLMGRKAGTTGAPTSVAIGSTLALAVALPVMVLSASALGLHEASGPRHDVACAVLGLLIGAPVALSLVYVRRHQVFLRPGLVAGALATAGFGFGALLIGLRCSCIDVAHMLIAHAGPIVLAAAVFAGVATWKHRRPGQA